MDRSNPIKAEKLILIAFLKVLLLVFRRQGRIDLAGAFTYIAGNIFYACLDYFFGFCKCFKLADHIFDSSFFLADG